MRSPTKVLLAIAFLLFGSLAAFGQAISGDIVGTVVDKSGAVIANANIEAVNLATNAKMSTVANANGEYRFTNLTIGTYNLTAVAHNFGAKTVQAVVELNKTNTVRFVMEVGAVATTVEVTEVASIINTTSAQLETTYEMKQVQDMPTATVGLGVVNLSLLQAGVGSSGGVGAGTGPSVGGQRPRNNNFTVEGVDNNDKGVTGPSIFIPNDAVANFSVLQNQYSPEFGHSTGGQFNQVVASGTNIFHGRLYEYLQNRNLNAVDYSLANQGITKNTRYDNNRFGGQLGGPIVKDKLFFFVNYERNPIGQATSPGSPVLAPTAGGFTTLGSISGVSSNNLNVLKQYALAPSACTAADIAADICPAGGVLDVAGKSVQLGILPIVGPNYQNFWALTTSADYNISNSDQLRVRYIYNKYSTFDNSAMLPVFYTSLPLFYHVMALNEYHTFSPTLTNEFRLGVNRNGNNYSVPADKFPGLDAFPNITIDDLGGINIGPGPNAPQYAIQNTYQLVDNLTWIRGNHSLKFGFEGRKYIAPQKFIQRARGDYEWSTLESYLLDQTPDALAERSFGTVGYSGDQYALYSFVNDTWKVRPNLSLNIGLRHEFTDVPAGWKQWSLNKLASIPGVISFDAPRAPKTNFMPRVGFAYSPGKAGNTSIRAGFGMGYDILYDNIGTLTRPPQIGSTTDCPDQAGCPAATAKFLASGGIKPTGQTGITILSVADARANTSGYLPIEVKYPYSMQWNLGIQHVFLKDYTLETRYLGTRGVHLDVQSRLNRINKVDAQHYLPTYLQAPSQATLDASTNTLTSIKARSSFDPAYAGFESSIVGYMPYGSSVYHGWATQLNRRFASGMQFQAAYTWSHTIDDSTADFFSTVLSPRRGQDFRNMPAERSNSALDRRHRLTVAMLYDVPWLKHSNAFLKNVVGNWEIAPVYTFETGEWADVQSGVDSNLNGDAAGDRAIFNPSGQKGTGTDVTRLYSTNTCASLPPADQQSCFDSHTVGYLARDPNAQYIRAREGALANSSRNTLLMPSINNWDLSVVKRIAFTERYKFEFAAQMLNAFNHPQFVAGSINQVNSIDRTDSGQSNYLTPGLPNFNLANITFPSNARTIQLSAKFTF